MPSVSSLLSAFDPTLPLDRARTIPAAWYHDREWAAAERTAVFGRTWQCVGRVNQVMKPGDFLTADAAGDPVLVIRGDDSVLRGFFNVCRHRAAPLCTDACGSATKLRCRYHGWTYDLAGRLKGTPEFDGVNEFAKEENGLVPLGGCETWGPFVWVHLHPPTIPLREFLSPLPSWVESRGGFGDLTSFGRRSYDLACNWKVYVDNYLDGGYHVNTVHPALAGVLDYKQYTTTTYDRTSLQSSPLSPGDGDAGRTRTGDLAAYWWAYPNFMVNLYAGVMDTNVVWPLAPDRCRVVFDFYFAAGTDPTFAEESVRVADRVQAEDVGICEEVQRGLHSSAYSVGRFSVKREVAGYHFHRLLASSIAAFPGSAHGQTR
jgi:choline monooxygenase